MEPCTARRPNGHHAAVSWFKVSAHEHIARARELAALLEQYGVPTRMLTTERPGYVVQRNTAVVGANAFAHEAGIHQDGMLKDARTYQIIDPAHVGHRMTLPLGKHSGRHAFARACAELGVNVVGEELNAAFRRFKKRADAGGVVALEDIFKKEVLA